MDVKEAILSRRSIRAYEDRPIRREDLEDILEAGMYAPSAVNFQPWYFVAIQNPEDMKRLLQIMGRVSQKIRPALEERFSKHPEIVEETSQFIRQMGERLCVFWRSNTSRITQSRNRPSPRASARPLKTCC